MTELGQGGARAPLLFLDQAEAQRAKKFLFVSVLPFKGTIFREFPTPPLPTHTQKITGRIKHSINMVFDTQTQVQKTIIRGEGAQQ